MTAQSFTRSSAIALSARERDVLAFLQSVLTDTYCPSFQEIADRCGLASKSSVHHAINGLREKGWIKVGTHERRSIELTDPFAGKPTDELMAMRSRIDRVLAGRAQ